MGMQTWHHEMKLLGLSEILPSEKLDEEVPGWRDPSADVTIESAIPYTLQVGSICMEVPVVEPEKQKIKPTFRTPCNNYIGRACGVRGREDPSPKPT